MMVSQRRSCGQLVLYDTLSPTNAPITRLEIVAGNEYHVGRDDNCEITVGISPLDNTISNQHLRVYAIDYGTFAVDVKPLVFAEDLSTNGTLLMRAADVTDPAIPTTLKRLRRGGSPVLLNNSDRLVLSPTCYIVFEAEKAEKVPLRTFQSLQRQNEDAKQFADFYSITRRLIGAGATSKVHLAYGTKSTDQLACKIIRLNYSWAGKPRLAASAGPVERLRYHVPDVEFLDDLVHPNIAAIERIFFNESTAYIFQELVPAGDLFSYLISKPDGFLGAAETALIIRQVLEAISHLHSKDIVHRDLKPENIMMTALQQGARIVLTDFGQAKRIEQLPPTSTTKPVNRLKRLFSIVGTDEYRAPDVEEKGGHGYSGKSADMWSIGIITAVLLSGHFFEADTSNSQNDLGTQIMQNARRMDLTRLQVHPDWKRILVRQQDFIKRLLTSEADRMTADQALKHHWFTNSHHKDYYDNLYQELVIAKWKSKPKVDNVVVELVPGKDLVQRHTTVWLPPRESQDSKPTLAGQREVIDETQSQASPSQSDTAQKRRRLDEDSEKDADHTVSKYFRAQSV